MLSGFVRCYGGGVGNIGWKILADLGERYGAPVETEQIIANNKGRRRLTQIPTSHHQPSTSSLRPRQSRHQHPTVPPSTHPFSSITFFIPRRLLKHLTFPPPFSSISPPSTLMPLPSPLNPSLTACVSTAIRDAELRLVSVA